MPDNEEDLLEADDAAKYLAAKWGIPSYARETFKRLMQRHGIEPARSYKRTTLWRKSVLDQIEKPDRSKPRPQRRKKGDEEPGQAAVQPWDLPAAALARAG